MDAKTREAKFAEFWRLFEDDRFEEADALLETIPMITLEELNRIVDESEIEDEALTPGEIEALARARERNRSSLLSRNAG